MSEKSESDEKVKHELKESLWYGIGQMVDEECIQHNRNATRQFIACLTIMVWTQLQTVALDLDSFSEHAGRKVVTTDDVLLLARRNSDLHRIIKEHIDKTRAKEALEKGAAAAAAGSRARGTRRVGGGGVRKR